MLRYNASTLDFSMPPNHASLQRFSSTLLPNASRLDFSSTLLTFYNTTRPLTLLHNISTCENAKEAGFLVRSPQGSNIQHVSILQNPPKFCNSICLERICTSATKTESHRTFNSTNLIMGAWKSITILQPSPRNQHNQHTRAAPKCGPWSAHLKPPLDCWALLRHLLPWLSSWKQLFNGHTVRCLGPNYCGWLPWSNTADPPNIHWNNISIKQEL